MLLRTRHALPLLLILPLLAALPSPAVAQSTQINRCTDASGATVFTDRSCQALGARPLAAPATAVRGNSGQLGPRDGCARRLSELTGQIQAAVSSKDVNRLSSIYLWGQLSSANANRILGQLESVVQRPLIDIVPIYPDSSLSHLDDDALAARVPLPEDPHVHAQVSSRPRPVGLRLEQTLANGSTPSRTVFNLRRQYNCFWITL